MMRQYKQMKQQYSDAILFFRLGDFYEMFEKDAKEVSSILNITLTKRHNIPMCGIPYHAAANYIGRLLRAGKKIAICEQTALPKGGKGIAEREVVEVITPGTVLEEDYLDTRRNNYLISVGLFDSEGALAYIDLSTGDFRTTSIKEERFVDYLRLEIQRLDPKELIIQESLYDENQGLRQLLEGRRTMVVNRIPDWQFDRNDAYRRLCSQFATANLKGFGLEEGDPALLPAAALLEYVEETAKTALRHISGIERYGDGSYMGIDAATQRNLELVRNLSDGSEQYTLIEVLDHAVTSPGARKIRSWLLHPLVERSSIEARLDSVEDLYHNQLLLGRLREELKGILDLQRLASRIALNKAHAKDLLSVGNSLRAASRVVELIDEQGESHHLPRYPQEGAQRLKELAELLAGAVHPDPSILLTEGRLIAEGYHAELDRLRNARRDQKSILDAYIEREKETSGISNLKLKYNKIIGYFFEITKSNLHLVPEHFIRRQSLVGSERFTTDELIGIESEVNSAAERALDLEREVFLDLRNRIKEYLNDLYRYSDFLAEIDVFASFAYAATLHAYVRPRLEEEPGIIIEEGRHPVVEKHLPPGEFVPNSLHLGGESPPFALITGPNMAGKSTVLRQTALICIMAQVGAFVPSARAQLGILDKVFCRVGASDNLARGESTFLVEMNETANILRYMTPRSLVIMDEVGRGTGTNDGLSIAWSVSEHIIREGVITLFATHYHELTALDDPACINLHMEVLEREGEIIFLKSLKPGAAAGSYGIHVARLAGVPDQVILRASEILGTLTQAGISIPKASASTTQVSLFGEEELVLQELKNIRPDHLSPFEALKLLYRLQDLLKQEAP